MKQVIRFATKRVGYGQIKATAQLNDGRSYSITTNATYYTDWITSEPSDVNEEDMDKVGESKIIVAKMIQEEHNLDSDWQMIED